MGVDAQPLKGHPISKTCGIAKSDALTRTSNSIASENSRKINRTETFQEVCRGSLLSTSRADHRGLGRHQRRGADLVPGFRGHVWLDSFIAGIKGGRYWGKLADSLLLAESMGWRLLVNAHRIPLAVQFSEKRSFIQRIAGPQQFQEWILHVGCGAACLV